MQIGQPIRVDGPETHLKKAGTPTMGGLLIITAIVAPTLLFANLTTPTSGWRCWGCWATGAIGFLDDYAKIKRGRNLLTARQKMLLQILLVLVLGVILMVLERLQLYSIGNERAVRQELSSEPADARRLMPQYLDLAAGVSALLFRILVAGDRRLFELR